MKKKFSLLMISSMIAFCISARADEGVYVLATEKNVNAKIEKVEVNNNAKIIITLRDGSVQVADLSVDAIRYIASQANHLAHAKLNIETRDLICYIAIPPGGFPELSVLDVLTENQKIVLTDSSCALSKVVSPADENEKKAAQKLEDTLENLANEALSHQ